MGADEQMNNKILLISPFAEGLADKTAYPPLGLLYLAANMHYLQPEVLIMDTPEFNSFGYPNYGISAHSVGVYKTVNGLIKTIKDNDPLSHIFIGGSGSVMFENDDRVTAIKGEGENIMGRVDISDLDNIQFPARHLVEKSQIVHTGSVHHSEKPSTTMIATRGCCFNCSFCDRITHGRKFRKRSVGNVLEEVMLLQDDYKIEHIRFVDDCIMLDRNWFKELCLGLGILGITWTCLGRTDLVDSKLLTLMKNSGCTEIFFGIETGSQALLDTMNKKTTVEINRQAIEMCRNAGLICCAYMMFGFPGEDEQTVDDTINFLSLANPPKSRISTFLPIPGTDVWENPQKYRVTLKDNYQDYWYFDCPEFGLNYDYIGDQNIMYGLRDKMMGFFKSSGYLDGWEKTNG